MGNRGLSGLLRLDGDLRIKAATFPVGDFLEGLDPIRCLLPPEVVRAPHRMAPFSRCLTLETSSTRHTLLINYGADGEDLVICFEPLDWTAGLCDNAAGYVCITDRDCMVVYANSALARRCERTELPILGCRVRDLCAAFGVDPTVIDHMTDRALDGEPLTHEFGSASGSDVRTTSCTPLRYCGHVCAAIWSTIEAPGHGAEDSLVQQHPSEAADTLELAIVIQRLHDAVAAIRTSGATQQLLAGMADDIHSVADLMGASLDDGGDPSGSGKVSAAAEIAIAMAGICPETRRLTFTHHVPIREPPHRYDVAGVAQVFEAVFRGVAGARRDAHVVISYAWSEQALHCIVEDDGPGGPASPDLIPRHPTPSDGIMSVLTRSGVSLESAPSRRGSRAVLRFRLGANPLR